MKPPALTSWLIGTVILPLCSLAPATAAPEAGIDRAISVPRADDRSQQPVGSACADKKPCKPNCSAEANQQRSHAVKRCHAWRIGDSQPVPEGMIGGAALSQP